MPKDESTEGKVEAQQPQEQAEQQAPQPQADTTDWRAKYEDMRSHSREWEKRAKANEAAGAELEKLKAENAITEAELEELRAKAERQANVASVAEKMHVPVEVVEMLNGSDTDELAKQVERLLKILPAYPTRTDDGGTRAVAKKSNAERFAEALFGN